MNLLDALRAGLDDARTNLGRTLLTLVGLTLGTASIVAVLALFGGAQSLSQDVLSEIGGAGTLIVRNGEVEGGVQTARARASPGLTLADARELAALPGVRHASPTTTAQVRIESARHAFNGTIEAVSPTYLGLNDIELARGRWITELDLDTRARVVVLGSAYADSLFGSADAALGGEVRVGGERYTVVGVLAREELVVAAWEGNALEWRNRRAFVPVTTHQGRTTGVDAVATITVAIDDPRDRALLEERVAATLLASHGVRDFTIGGRYDAAEQGMQYYFVFNVIFLMVGVIALLAGGVVITNVLLASVVEKTREIGTRMAVGAAAGDVFAHYLVQAVLITGIGGAGGVLLALTLTSTMRALMQFPAQVTPLIALAGLGTATAVGLAAGVYPAYRAARLDPVEALRYE
ncbi:MAG TPA: ABC transporter permease [Longimicrobiales bacterium]|nr:ABC transporter permease [Longimicrobiales bacterium]